MPTVRAVARVAPISTPTARGRATVLGAIDPVLRNAPPYVPAPRPAPAKDVATPQSAVDAASQHPFVGGVATPHPVVDDGPAPPAFVDSRPQADGSAGPDQSEAPPAPNPEVRLQPTRLKRISKKVALPIAAALIAAFVGATSYLIIEQPAVTGNIGRWTGDRAAAPIASAPGDAQADLAPFAVPADGTANPFGAKTPALTGRPTRLKVKAIGLDTSLETLKLGANGELTPPKSFPKAGWYADGTLPGDTGPAVIAGHVDSKSGPAVFYKLRELTAGDRIEVVRGGQTVQFTVTSTAWYPKTKFPTDQVYGPTPDRQLRLITCGGVFDRSLRSYKDNLVVYAVAG